MCNNNGRQNVVAMETSIGLLGGSIDRHDKDRSAFKAISLGSLNIGPH